MPKPSLFRAEQTFPGGGARANGKPCGFSLTEVVLAIGILCFAGLAIIGLVPVAHKTALESRRETRAAYLAEQIFGDIRSSADAGAGVLYGANDALGRLDIDLSSTGTYALGCTGSQPIRPLNEGAYASGIGDALYECLAQVSVQTLAEMPDLSRVEVEISMPPAAPLERRSRFNFVTYVRR